MIGDPQAPPGKDRGDTGLAFRVKLFADQFRLQHQRAQLPLDAKRLGQQREQIPARRAGQVGIEPPPLVVDIFRQARIHPADGKVLAVLVEQRQRAVAGADEAASVERVGVHHGHMAEHRAVFFLAKGKAKATSQIQADFAEIGVEPVTAHRGIKEIVLHGPHQLWRLLIGGDAAHQREDLPRQRHPHAEGMVALHPLPVVIVVAVEPAVTLPIAQPLLRAEVAVEPIRFGRQVARQVLERQRHLAAARSRLAGGKVGLQPFLFGGGRIIIQGRGQGIQQQLQLTGQLHLADAQRGQFQHQPAQVAEVAGVKRREGHALAARGGHIQAVVPIGPLQFEVVARRPHVEKGHEVLHQ